MNVQYAKEVIKLPAQSGGKAETLLMRLIRAGYYVDAPCGGKGTCGRCRVRFVSEAPQPTANERRLLTEEERSSGVRLACEVRVTETCSLQLPVSREQEIDVLVTADAAGGENAGQTAGGGIPGQMARAIPGQTAGGAIPSQMAGAISGQMVDGGIPGQTAGDSHGQRHCAATHSGEDAAKTRGQSGKKRCGAAVDIGTTTLAATLFDLEEKKRIAAASSVNHQRAYGADVLSRIQAANEGATEELRLSICRDIDALLAGLVADAGIPDDAVEELVIVGNTTMCHLLRGLSCAELGAAPFTPEDLSLWEGSSEELALSERWSAAVTIFPGISAFVGADIVAGIYALEMDRKQNALLLDIGTNGEMAAGGADGFLVTSAAAGPVFEGGNISCGVAGVPGAVTSLALERDPAATGGIRTVEVSTIAGETPVGLCGTGIIDAVGEAVRLGLIDENGTFEEPWFTDGMPVAEGRFRFLQEDVRQVQMGKAAIRAGIETLLAEYGGGDPEEILIAGGFGCRMNEEQAIRIGLFPEQFRGHITMTGNSALAGAERYLLADRTSAKQRLASVTEHTEELSLAMHPKFNELYLEEMFFDTDR